MIPGLESISSTTIRALLASGDVEGAAVLVPPGMRADLATADRLDDRAAPGAAAPRPGPMSVGRRALTLRVAAVQDAPIFLDRDATLDKALSLIEIAAADGVKLVVFPEAFLPGYPDWVGRTVPGGEDATALYGALFDNAVVIGSAVTQVLGLAAQRYGVYLSIGIQEKEATGSTLYNTQLLFDPDAVLVSVHRQLVSAGPEQFVWGQGDGSGLAVVETPYGRLGTLTGGENYMPLARAALYAGGVDIYLAPAWNSSEVWPSTMRHVAKEGRVFVVGVNQCVRAEQTPDTVPGRHRLYGPDQAWLARGGTMIVDPTGNVLAGPVSETPGIVTADIDANQARHERLGFDALGHHGRADVFQLHVDTTRRSSMTPTGHDRLPVRSGEQGTPPAST